MAWTKAGRKHEKEMEQMRLAADAEKRREDNAAKAEADRQHYQNEEKIGYVVYVNNDYQEGKLRESICNKIYNYFIKSYNNFRILEKFFMKTKYKDKKEK